MEADHTIHVIPKNAGKVTIKIKAVPGEGNFYREASVDYTLTVKRQEVSFENVTWNKASKVYDGNTGIELTGTVNTEKITIPKEKAAIAGSDVAVNEQNEAQPQNVTVAAGIYYMTVEGNGTANYQLVVEESPVFGASSDCANATSVASVLPFNVFSISARAITISSFQCSVP